MALSRTFDLMTRKVGTPTNGEWDRYIAPPSRRGVGLRGHVSERSLDALSEDDIKAIDVVWDEYGRQSVDALVHDVHYSLDEWVEIWADQRRKRAAVKVPYEKLFETVLGMDESDASEAAAEVAYFQSMGQSGESRKIA